MITLLLASLAVRSASGQEDEAIIAPIKPLPPVSQCDTVKCPAGTQCVLHQIFCITTPCPTPIPTCEPIGDSKCPGKNQVWSDCGSACPKRCEQKEPVMCPAVCRPGCVCKKGFCLNKLGQCVADKNCAILNK